MQSDVNCLITFAWGRSRRLISYEPLNMCPEHLRNWVFFIGGNLTLMLLVANLANTKWCKKLKNDRSPGTWVLIWEYSARHPKNTNMTRLKWLSKLCVLVFQMRVASALEGLIVTFLKFWSKMKHFLSRDDRILDKGSAYIEHSQGMISCSHEYMLVLNVQGLWLTLMLLVANLAITKWCKKPEKLLKPWQTGTHLRVLSKSYQNEYQHNRVSMFFKKSWILVFWTKVASALEGLMLI